MIQPNSISIYVFGDPMGHLADWLSEKAVLGYDWRRWKVEYRLDTCRNQAVDHFLKSGRDYIVMLDQDVYPYPIAEIPDTGIDKLLNEEGELIYSGWSIPPRSHYGDGDFAVAACRISAGLLRDMGGEWFYFPSQRDTYEFTSCDCGYFSAHAALAGRKSKMVGVAGHIRKMIAFAGPDGKIGFVDPARI